MGSDGLWAGCGSVPGGPSPQIAPEVTFLKQGSEPVHQSKMTAYPGRLGGRG